MPSVRALPGAPRWCNSSSPGVRPGSSVVRLQLAKVSDSLFNVRAVWLQASAMFDEIAGRILYRLDRFGKSGKLRRENGSDLFQRRKRYGDLSCAHYLL